MNAKLEQELLRKLRRKGEKRKVKGGPVLVTTKRYILHNFFNILFFTFIAEMWTRVRIILGMATYDS